MTMIATRTRRRRRGSPLEVESTPVTGQHTQQEQVGLTQGKKSIIY